MKNSTRVANFQRVAWKWSAVWVGLRFLGVAVCMAFLTTIGLAENKAFKSREDVVEYLDKAAVEGRFSGVAMVVTEGEVVFDYACGIIDLESRNAIDRETLFNVGSISKVFTGTCILKLVEEGKVDLDDPVVEYVPDFTVQNGEKITIRHLLTMRSGLGSYFEMPRYRHERRRMKNIEDYLPTLNEMSLDFEPGSEEAYSNAGYELLGILIQRVSGMSYYDFVERTVYEPAGMTRSGAFDRDALPENAARSYTQVEAGPLPDESLPAYARDATDDLALRGSAAGGSYSSIGDLHRFAVAFGEGKILGEEMIELTFDRYEIEGDGPRGFGLVGGTNGVNALLHVEYDKNMIVVVLSNFDPPVAMNLGIRLVRTVRAGHLGVYLDEE